MKKMKKNIWWLAVMTFVGGLLGLFFLKSCDSVPAEEENVDVNISCDYFNGIVMEVTGEYLSVDPTADWEWQEVSRVMIPLKSWKEFDSSEWKSGDMIRVAYNSSTMEWGDDEVSIGIVFNLFIMEDDEK